MVQPYRRSCGALLLPLAKPACSQHTGKVNYRIFFFFFSFCTCSFALKRTFFFQVRTSSSVQMRTRKWNTHAHTHTHTHKHTHTHTHTRKHISQIFSKRIRDLRVQTLFKSPTHAAKRCPILPLSGLILLRKIPDQCFRVHIYPCCHNAEF